MNICVIPARIGSKRIKKKNIKNFFGKPIISYVIKETLKSKIFDDVVVSTDSAKIANVSKKNGASIYFKRPNNLCSDETNTVEIVRHAINYLKGKNLKIKNVCCVYPTAVLITSKQLINSFKEFKKNRFNFLFSAQKFPHPIQRAIIKKKNGLKMLKREYYNKQSNHLLDTYYDAGQFYWGSLNCWLKKNVVFEKKSSIYLLTRYDSVDINIDEDWNLAKILFKYKNSYRSFK